MRRLVYDYHDHDHDHDRGARWRSALTSTSQRTGIQGRPASVSPERKAGLPLVAPERPDARRRPGSISVPSVQFFGCGFITYALFLRIYEIYDHTVNLRAPDGPPVRRTRSIGTSGSATKFTDEPARRRLAITGSPTTSSRSSAILAAWTSTLDTASPTKEQRRPSSCFRPLIARTAGARAKAADDDRRSSACSGRSAPLQRLAEDPRADQADGLADRAPPVE